MEPLQELVLEAGVAIAITVGGPGAIFWMWFAAVLGGASAFKQRLLGKDPVFYASSMPGLKEIEWWGAEKQTANSTNTNKGVEKS
ncbi:alanine:cation symporter family protein [Bacillus sp. NMCC4]|uniref:alanine:cation symporter family protein n=1 Tax=Bacillus sp. NMCC4 TaxID=2108539 RepID=UPI001CB9783B|nr:alanine:cation symporter family protein [Bacillus sp. NMCC4]